MRMIQLVCAGAALLIATLAIACGDDEENRGDGGSPTPDAGASDFPLTLEQSDGAELTLATVPQRVISLSAHATEVFCEIGAGDQLIAVDLYENCPHGSDGKPQLDAFQPSLETIVGYEPDLVYISTNTQDIGTSLRDAGVAVLYLELPTTLDGVYEQIEVFGRVTGHPAEAQQLVADIRTQVEAIEDVVADVDDGPRVFHELDPLYFTVSPDTFIGEFYMILRAQNIAEGSSELYPQLSSEVIVERDPEVIVLADEPAGVTADSVKQRPGWDAITAVQNDRICVVEADLVSRPGANVGTALETLAECLYPEKF